jgi:hypothetical protein
MSGPQVDVLAVMDADASMARTMRARGGSSYLAELTKDSAEARAAVVELISAARDYADVIENGYDVTQTAPAKARLRAAIARCKVQP